MIKKSTIEPSHKIFILGPGRVGLSLCLLFERAGLGVLGVWGRKETSVAKARGNLRCPLFYGPIPEEVGEAEVLLITTVDGAIEEVAGMLVESGKLTGESLVFHCSGVFDAGLLHAVKERGAFTGTIHPLQAVPTVKAGLRFLPQSYFLIDGDGRAVEAGEALIQAIGGTPIVSNAVDRGLYHASASLASNYLVTLIWSAAEMISDAGLKGKSAMSALQPMVKNVVERVMEMGPHKALTGPIARGDVETLKMQLDAVNGRSSSELFFYLALASRTMDLAEEMGDLEDKKIKRMRDLLESYRSLPD